MDAIAQNHHATAAIQALMKRIRELMHARDAHAARTVVLAPYVQLLAFLREAWAVQGASGFAPRFETTTTWIKSLASESDDATSMDISMDMGRDLLTARAWLERAGLQAQADLLSGRLVEAAWHLAPVAAAVPRSARAEWAAKARASIATGFDAPQLALESAVARIALEWAAASSRPTDVLLEDDALADVELLVVLEGLQSDPLAHALLTLTPAKSVGLPLAAPGALGSIRLHEAGDPSEEAARAAACVIDHVNAGRVPVALAAVDREVTRRIHAMLAAHGVAVRDETGWKLSTTRRAADVMLALRACAWNAASDEVIDWLKNCPQVNAFTALALERQVRREDFVREWRSFRLAEAQDESAVADLARRTNEWRESMQGVRSLPQWLASLRAMLQSTGQWAVLEGDKAGTAVIAALSLDEGMQQDLAQLPQAQRRWSLADFTTWVNESLEAANFKPDVDVQEQVVILPVSQVLGRPFPALVMPGCDEMRLVASPEPSGMWTPAQRGVLGLPSRELLEAQTRAAWQQALQTPHCDLLWRRSDESGEPLLPGTLVQQLRLAHGLDLAADPRTVRSLDANPTPRPTASGERLHITKLSPTAYADLRACPYRFFAMRQMGLQEADEIDTDVDKRHFGNWLHKVLNTFHENLHAQAQPPGLMRMQMLEDAAQQVTRAMRLDDGEFLPFAAAWPRTRDAYLEWLAKHEADERAAWLESEQEHSLDLGKLKLSGRIDRIDKLPDGTKLVIDYKTEALNTSRERVKDPAEDTQLAFYAALLSDDTLRAAYVNVGERETKLVEQEAIVGARDLLVHGILDEVARIEAGAKLPAHGEGKVCDFCGARGLCRKDFWS
ncbi:PD-(D/E)XK nuclease family protein [Caenimonas koreensis]|uniref:PD-(D/E)XK nuclease family protein n=1 Tax=Caenimonas koreensis TaxID=367474 RepID=UPI003784E10B